MLTGSIRYSLIHKTKLLKDVVNHRFTTSYKLNNATEQELEFYYGLLRAGQKGIEIFKD